MEVACELTHESADGDVLRQHQPAESLDAPFARGLTKPHYEDPPQALGLHRIDDGQGRFGDIGLVWVTNEARHTQRFVGPIGADCDERVMRFPIGVRQEMQFAVAEDCLRAEEPSVPRVVREMQEMRIKARCIVRA